MKLFEIEHDYYCNPENFHERRSVAEYDSWESFFNDEGFNQDDGLNLVFRWDWKRANDDTEPDGSLTNPTDVLRLFYMGQRKGAYRSVRIVVTLEDEPEIRKWLEERWAYMVRLWAPISEGT